MDREADPAASSLVEFGGLYGAYAKDLRRFALYLSGDQALADDLVSEAFVRVWGARERVELPTVRGYLFAIVRNLFLRHVRDRHPHTPLDEAVADVRPGPEDQASGRSELRVVLAALAELPEIDRAALLMRADDRVSYEEIAAALGISVSSAKVKVHRARLKLAEARLSANGKGEQEARTP